MIIMTTRFEKTKLLIAEQISKSLTREDPSHAANTMQWVLNLRPDADEIILLAGFGHDIERSLPDRYRSSMFASYDDYKHAHAARAGKLTAKIAQECGYSKEEVTRLIHVISEGEFQSNEPDVQLLCDADSISFFDNNLRYYLAIKGPELAKKKMMFAYERASDRAKQNIRQIMIQKPDLDLLRLGTKN